jgi:tetratricopeptide (TPR) repeat protein
VVQQFAAASHLKPDSIRSHDLLSGALISAGRTDEAIDEMLTVMRLQERQDQPGAKLPNERLAAYISLGDLLLAMNRPDEAAALYRKILQQLPGDRTALTHLQLCIFRIPSEHSARRMMLGAAE